MYIYFDSLHVSSNHVLITRRVNYINTTGMQVGKELPDLHTGRSPTHSDIHQKLY